MYYRLLKAESATKYRPVTYPTFNPVRMDESFTRVQTGNNFKVKVE